MRPDKADANWTDEGPVFTSSSAFSLVENGTSAGTVVATDADSEDNIESYSTTGGADQAQFEITNAGVLTFRSAPNFENPLDAISTDPPNAATNNEYIVVVTATSGTGARALTARDTLTVTVTNVDEAGVVTFSESNVQVGTALTATLTDPDGSITGETWQGWERSTDQSAWTIITGATSDSYTPIAEDAGNYLRATVSYTDGQGPNKRAQAVTANMVVPTLPITGPGNLTFEENTTLEVIGTYTYTRIFPEDATLTWSVSGDFVAADCFFIIREGRERGKLIIGFAAKDFETPRDANMDNVYTGRVRVSDGVDINGNPDPAVDDSLDVVITATNVDEVGVVTFSESNVQVGTALTATLTDPDGSVTGETWQWERSADQLLAWTIITGATSDSYTPVLDDAGNYLRATVSYTDGEGSGKRAQAVTANMVVAPPITGDVNLTVQENTTSNVIETYTYTRTFPANATLTWDVSGDFVGCFFIVREGREIGNLTIGFAEKDYETPGDADGDNVYMGRVQVSDGVDANGNPDPAIDHSLDVVITVTDVNEGPVFSSAMTFEVAENEQSVGTVVAEDEDREDSITGYAITGGADQAQFAIDVSTGALSFQTAPDFEASADVDNNNTYVLEITATGGTGDRALTAVQTLTITVTDENEGPVFSSAMTFDVVENERSVGTVEAEDEDSEDSIESYVITGGADQAQFAIDASTGELTFNAAPDFEASADVDNNTYILEVTATGGTGDRELTAEQILTITVTNVDEAGVVTFSESADIELNVVLTATLTDPDGSVTGETWQWEGSSDQLDWTIIMGATSDSYTPTIEDAGNYLRATVSYTDGQGSGKRAQAVTPRMVVTPPITSDDSGNIMVEENIATTTLRIYRYTRPYPANATLTWTLSGDLADSVAVMGSDSKVPCFFIAREGRDEGILSIGFAAKNYEAARGNVYMGRVEVSDGVDTNGNPDPAIDAFLDVVVTVTDVNEGPVFSSATTFEVAENSQSVGTMVAADEDSEDSIEGYAITGGVDKDQFAIDASGALTFNAAPDFENPSDVMSTTPSNAATNNEYIVEVTATGGTGDRALTAVQTLTITVTDENEGPVFSSAMAFEVVENEQSVGTVEAEDVDSEDSIESYAITGGVDKDQFAIDALTGELSFQTAPDFEASADVDNNNTYILEVTATGGTGTREKTAEQILTITVTNVDEAGVVTFSESGDIEIDVALTATFTDPDGGVTGETWQWERSSDQSAWTIIAGATSDSYTPSAEDAGNYLRATVSYTDGQGSNKQTQAVTANMVEMLPITGPGNLTFEENTTLEVVGTYTYTRTFPASATLTWSVSGDLDGCFFIAGEGRDTGILTIGFAAKNYEAARGNVYMGRVRVSDGVDTNGNPDPAVDDSLDVVVTVTNVDEAGVVTFSESGDIEIDVALTATFTDPDGGVTGETWQWERSSDQSAWTIIAGATSDSYTPALEDGGNYLRATVSYTDGEGPNKRAQVVTANMVVQTLPITGPGNLTFEENTNLTEVGTYTYLGTFPADATLTWSLSGDFVDYFSIAPDSDNREIGKLTILDSAKDYETPGDADRDNVYMGRVRVSDGVDTNGNPDPAVDDSLEVVITITDVNEMPGVSDPPTMIVSSDRLIVSWTEPANTGPAITDYDVQYRQTDSEDPFTHWDPTNTSTDLSITITGISSDNVYEVQVRATNAEGTGDWSGSGYSIQPPPAPTLSRVDRGNDEALLRWKEATDNTVVINKYQYRQSEDGVVWSDWEDIPESEPSTSTTLFYPLRHLVTRLTNGTIYHFQVRAVSRGVGGEASNSKTVTPAAVPHIPSNFSVQPGHLSAILTWDNPNDATITRYQYSVRIVSWRGPINILNSDATTTSYTLPGLVNNFQQAVILRAVNSVGSSPPTQRVYVTPMVASKPALLSDIESDIEFVPDMPDTFSVAQNYPNPFNPETTIPYGLPEGVHVRLVIYNVLGQEVRTLVNGMKPAGYHRVVWDNKDDFGKSVSSGIYLYRIVAGDFVERKKMLLLK